MKNYPPQNRLIITKLSPVQGPSQQWQENNTQQTPQPSAMQREKEYATRDTKNNTRAGHGVHAMDSQMGIDVNRPPAAFTASQVPAVAAPTWAPTFSVAGRGCSGRHHFSCTRQREEKRSEGAIERSMKKGKAVCENKRTMNTPSGCSQAHRLRYYTHEAPHTSTRPRLQEGTYSLGTAAVALLLLPARAAVEGELHLEEAVKEGRRR